MKKRPDTWLLLAILASFGVRLAISACSVGTNDTLSFMRFAHSIDELCYNALCGAGELEI